MTTASSLDLTPPLGFDVLLAYWHAELTGDETDVVEEILFADDESARRLDVLTQLGAGTSRLLRAGRLSVGLTVDALDELARQGVTMRTYELSPADTLPCGIGSEHMVVVRLRGALAADEDAIVDLELLPADEPPIVEHLDAAPVDRTRDEIVLIYPGDFIRKLPRTKVRYRVRARGPAGEREVGEYFLEHAPTVVE